MKFDLIEIIDRFIDDFECGNGLADHFRYIAILGAIRFAYIIGVITRDESYEFVKQLHDCVGSFYGDLVCSPYNIYIL